MSSPKVGFVSLGCPKALTDSELILTQLSAEGYQTSKTFEGADLVIVNKTDLLAYVDFDIEIFSGYAQSLNRTAEIMPLSVKSGDGLDAWYAWLRTAAPAVI